MIVPIIENTPEEEDLTSWLVKALAAYPHANAVLVRRHGVYVWGETWQKAKTMCECYDYLFEIAVKMRTAGIDPSKPPADSLYLKEMDAYLTAPPPPPPPPATTDSAAAAAPTATAKK